MNPTFLDKIISIVSYCTFGIGSIIWIVFSYITKKRIDSFLLFNLYQAIFISIVLAIFSLIYDIAINIMSVIPFIGPLFEKINILITRVPIIYSMSLTGLLVTGLLFYLSVLCLIGKKPRIPGISDLIASNFGG